MMGSRAEARERVNSELQQLRSREKGASPEELKNIVDRKTELKKMRGLGVYYGAPKEESGFTMPDLSSLSLPGGFALPKEIDAELMAQSGGFGTAAMGITGFIFMTLTAAEKQGFMTARARGEGEGDRGHVKEKTMKLIDTDGDGELSQDDMKKHFGKLVAYMTGENSAPAGAVSPRL
ncbi:hypothetical protein EMIHUDRAFT_200201 [Emiliania huxleyi CCMP1516]|uniref:EF-hand domain-containing protein n=2 Tax=Emiliania huxleyi TaxID=2903 RepID=A0A0D3KV57_EMIH1|nr:hypothetical protein EMIHUDRAFT_200201 [Emiliania huxleyi CCMP1516]EOD39642.1 hypothetical protein EMIHUDRAFT_200201 [Emiliania huxleyi CCMP1516]|eukprot:XP_005792071.1 hypothetical protein EMIHUDRAFT_200201 [Emiliania huxleyi CCMP1516]